MTRAEHSTDGSARFAGNFDDDEYARRLEQVCRRMTERELDQLLIQCTPNVAYLTGFNPPRGNAFVAVILSRKGRAVAYVADEDSLLLPSHGWIDGVRVIGPGDWSKRFAHIANEVGQRGATRVGIEMGRYPVTAESVLVLRAQLGGIELVDASDLILGLRHVKSPSEIALMREAARISGMGMRAALDAVHLGHTDNDIGAAAYGALVRGGSEATYPAPFIMIGERTGWGPHLSWKRFPLQNGDPVNIELTGVWHRYAAPLYRTACIGRPSSLLAQVCDAVIACVNTVLTTARPGEPASAVAARATKKLDPIRDVAYCTGQVSYGVGLTIGPNWVEHSFRIIEGNDQPLVPGMTFHAPTAVRVPGKLAVCFSETWVMTEEGPEILTDFPRELFIGEA